MKVKDNMLYKICINFEALCCTVLDWWKDFHCYYCIIF